MENRSEASPATPLIVKVGGGEGIDLPAVCADIAEIHHRRPVVLIHGGSHEMNQVATALGHPPRFLQSPSGFTSRYTDPAAIDVMKMVYAGKINKTVVESLAASGVQAIGLSGLDGSIWVGPRKGAIKSVEGGRTRIVRDSQTGRVDRVNAQLLNGLIRDGYVPVLTPPALSDDGVAINVDGDRAAAATAIALHAQDLVILSNVPGVLADFPCEQSLISEIVFDQLDDVRQRYARGRMRIKLLAAAEALEGDVQRVVLGDARPASPVSVALEGQGTVIKKVRESLCK